MVNIVDFYDAERAVEDLQSQVQALKEELASLREEHQKLRERFEEYLRDCERWMMTEIRLTTEEAKAICDLIDGLIGCNPERTFTWDGAGTPSDPCTSALVKVFAVARREVPSNLLQGGGG